MNRRKFLNFATLGLIAGAMAGCETIRGIKAGSRRDLSNVFSKNEALEIINFQTETRFVDNTVKNTREQIL